MLPIPDDILKQYDTILRKKAVSQSLSSEYKKWLRYYLDFRAKYTLPHSRSEHVRLFVEKLRQKKQSQKQQEQAAYALSLFFASQTEKQWAAPSPQKVASSQNLSQPISGQSNRTLEAKETVPQHHGESTAQKGRELPWASPLSHTPPAPRSFGGKRFGQWQFLEKTKSSGWDKIVADLVPEIKEDVNFCIGPPHIALFGVVLHEKLDGRF